tara:strand:- start:2317 stop:3915 length:1599 start_codon:yes stop_codon:yes gene_type:complete
MSALKVLDCTLRDGGYYNNWRFDKDLVADYLNAINKSNIDVIEIGFRSIEKNKYFGEYAYSTDSYLNKIIKKFNFKIAVMINAKDLIEMETNNVRIEKFFKNKKLSKVDIIRVACHFEEVAKIINPCKTLKKLGYKLIINFMGTGIKTDKELTKITQIVNNSKLFSVVYFADSFGNMVPNDIKKKYKIIRKIWKGETGFHAHNNLGFALQNALKAREIGINWIDCTILGMGRGAGNVETEILIYNLKKYHKKYKDDEILKLSHKRFRPLKNKFEWGPNIFYYISAKNKIHPTYTQELLSDNRYSADQIVSSIKTLSSSDSSKYKFDKLQDSLMSQLNKDNGSWNATDWCKNKDVLFLGAGKSLENNKDKIAALIRGKKFICISLNINKFVESKFIDMYLACHPSRVLLEINQYKRMKSNLIIPNVILNNLVIKKLKKTNLKDFGLKIKQGMFKPESKSCILPSSLAIGYGLALAVTGRAKNIFLLGFDGYHANDTRQKEMNDLISLYKANKNNPKIFSLSQTTYNIPQKNLL